MHEDLEQQLYQNHPELFLRGYYPIQFNCGNGWFNILDQLFYSITDDYTEAQTQLDIISRPKLLKKVCDETLLKYRTKVAEQEALLPEIIEVRSYNAGLLVWCKPETDKVSYYINFAERMALCTCELCGNPGTMRRSGMWQIRCESCNENIDNNW